MREIKRKKRFKIDLSRVKSPEVFESLKTISYYLAKYGELPSEYDAHPLYWQWMGFWDVHLDDAKDDLILVYRVTPKKVYFVRIVTHKELGESKP